MKASLLINEYPRRILLVVTGLSPQIVTETLYALAIQHKPVFVPTEVYLITTLEGAKLAKTSLLHRDGGQFHSLLADYPALKDVRFSEESIHVIYDGSGLPLTDIRTPEQNTAAADTICALVGELTQDKQSALHVSIAGGRKTMGFYLGYAFSMFARPQDRLSHVLISSPFESHPDFFYPPKIPRRLTTRDGQHIDTDEAIVTLAEIPFVRLRHGLPTNLVNGTASFSETVSALQRSFAAPELIINLEKKVIYCGGIKVELQPQLLAWYAWHAKRRKQTYENENFIHWRDINPEDFLIIYSRITGQMAASYEKIESQLKEDIEHFSQQKNAKINRILKQKLGSASDSYLITRIGKKPYTKHGLSLDANCITLCY
ncbi:MAG TPA: CRISPR-associated ring nuclease Csm6 [Ferrovaceae bacterium]|nr:CRISPR-associated ring nuclease Csm6 [Ferrovaceae bacterium]